MSSFPVLVGFKSATLASHSQLQRDGSHSIRTRNDMPMQWMWVAKSTPDGLGRDRTTA